MITPITISIVLAVLIIAALGYDFYHTQHVVETLYGKAIILTLLMYVAFLLYCARVCELEHAILLWHVMALLVVLDRS